MIDQERLLDDFIALTRIDRPSRREAAAARFLRRRLQELGATVMEDGAATSTGGDGGNLLARWPGQGSTTLLFCAHMDVVTPANGIEPRREDDLIVSAGETVLGADDGAGLCAILAGIRAVMEYDLPHPPLEVLFTVCEEVGLLGVKYAVAQGQLTAKYGFTFDGGNPQEVVIAGPAQDSFTITVLGKAAHAGVHPEEGINAIQTAAQAIASLPLGRLDEETTANIGVIHGGQATNIVPDLVTIEGEARSHDPQKLAEVTQKIAQSFTAAALANQAVAKIQIERAYEAFHIPLQHPLLTLLQAAMAKTGLEMQTTASGGGSDSNVLNAAGIPTVTLGCGMHRVHTTDEYLAIPELVQAARLVYQLVTSQVDNG
ncbi:MAG TPA: M20/M25/M40 family metallo-hydrolase [Firmicutes bacterium]|nr:M20/M25/M40 family metallo-hydrolase [Bacillota bacterium]